MASTPTCPFCGSPDLVKAAYREYRRFFLLLARPLRCTTCGSLFGPPGGYSAPVVALLFGLVLATYAGLIELAPRILAVTHNTSGRTVLRFVSALATIVSGVVIFGVGLRGLLHRGAQILEAPTPPKE